MGVLVMSEKERRRIGIMERVASGDMRLSDAAKILGMSYRQVRRIRARYSQEGDMGLVHRSRGRKSNHGYPQEVRSMVLRLYQESYAGFGPTLFAEYLLERHGIAIDHETLRRWLLEEGLRKKVRRKAKHRQRRKRKEHFGEMVQLDGSFHEWFSGQGERYCLMVMVDDATGCTMALLSQEETTEAAMRLLRLWVECYGVPCSLYTDRKSVYITDREPTLEEELSGEEPLGHSGRRARSLGYALSRPILRKPRGEWKERTGCFRIDWSSTLPCKG